MKHNLSKRTRRNERTVYIGGQEFIVSIVLVNLESAVHTKDVIHSIKVDGSNGVHGGTKSL